MEILKIDAAPTPAAHIMPLPPHALKNIRHPSQDLYVIGITGTNGKTTVSYLVGEVLKLAGHKTFVLGTYNSGNKNLSTPVAIDLLQFMKAHFEEGGTHFVMEVTSEGIDQARVLDVDFNVKLLTNITQDHLDYHKTFERYESTKLGFMSEGEAHKIYPLQFAQTEIKFETCLLGDYNLLNIKAAASILRHMDVAEEYIEQALSTCAAPSGRLESVDKGQPFLVLVDYAHTPDGLKNMLSTVKEIAQDRNGRLMVLFGCGGDRDRGKRPEMGKIASEFADYMVITDDNPRSEDSQTIMSEIVAGIRPGFDDYILLQNRREAIELIIGHAESRDVVVLAGKGHETSQILQTQTVHFDDREEAMHAISIQ